MVVFDLGNNGYRDIILPLACQDEAVGKAVSVVAAFHLGKNATHLHVRAEATQQAILSKLLRDSMELTPSHVFSLSTWAAILVLLVGDTITGSANYILLLQILRHLAYSSVPNSSIPANAQAFLLQQTKMFTTRFELFGAALTPEHKSLELLSGPLDSYLEFLSSTASPLDTMRYTNMVLIRTAIQAACELCANRIRHSCSYVCPPDQLESLKQTILVLEPSVDGAHALVWSCFVAAAESVQPEYRAFFSERLGSLYECTRFGTIPMALETLKIIWAKQGKQKWTEFVTRERPILIM
ncbi:hypothetical protein HJFPF1_02412 [Paramyrothecium foliicola]|nr:hypothetical protein HJFPF1_02412 [Paramyrothecium foliicola]